VLGAQAIPGRLDADAHAAPELDALGRELREAAIEHGLVELEVGDAVAQEPAGAVGGLVHDRGVAGARELLRAREPRGPRADDRDPPTGAQPRRRRARDDPAALPRALGQLFLDVLDGHRRAVEPEHARRLARRRAQPAGELREVVGRVEPPPRRLPLIAPQPIVEVGDRVAERTALHAERHAAVHAATGLLTKLGLGLMTLDLAPVEHAQRDRSAKGVVARPLEEAGGLAHQRTPAARGRWAARRACSTRRYSTGITFTKRGTISSQLSSSLRPSVEPVSRT
jgi:hypothetical protein